MSYRGIRPRGTIQIDRCDHPKFPRNALSPTYFRLDYRYTAAYNVMVQTEELCRRMRLQETPRKRQTISQGSGLFAISGSRAPTGRFFLEANETARVAGS